jgi:uncharacterized membrane protein YfcA
MDVAISPPAPPSDPPRQLRYWSWWLAVFALAWVLVWLQFPEPAALIEAHWPLILVGFAGAVLGNATAIGGGLVFIPVMIFVYQYPAFEALMLALAAQAFGMTSGAVAWLARGEIPWRRLEWILVPMLAGCAVSALVLRPNALLIKGLFGPVSIGIGLITLLMLRRISNAREIPDRDRWMLAFVSLLGGLLTGWVAIGVGEVVAAYLILRWGLKPERAIGLGVVLLAITSIALTILHHVVGDIPWTTAWFLILGCVFGARLGPFLAQWVGQRQLKIVFATVAIADGILFVIQYLRS